MRNNVIILLSLVSLTISAKAQDVRPLTAEDSVRIAGEYFERGYSEYLPGNLDLALALFDSSLAYNPHSEQAWHSRGSTLARMNEHESAQQAFNEALRLKPDYGAAWWHRGCDNAVAGRADTALSDLKHAIQIDSKFKSWPAEDPCWDSLLNDPRLIELTRP